MKAKTWLKDHVSSTGLISMRLLDHEKGIVAQLKGQGYIEPFQIFNPFTQETLIDERWYQLTDKGRILVGKEKQE